MKILGLHIRETDNAGDRWSCALDYLAFPEHEVVKGDMRRPPDVCPDVVVYGGGSIVTSPDFRRWPGTLMIAWGVGHHERVRPWDDLMRAAHVAAAGICNLYFPRDGVGGFGQVPCASCLNPIFDASFPEPIHAVVRYSAARRIMVDEPSDAPHMTNEDGDIEKAVRFLASGETVITSSYHGAYWAGLLGRKVRIVPWGSKFEYLPRHTLAECRALNMQAYRTVRERIGRAAA